MTLKLLLVGKEKSDFQSIKDAFENEDINIIVATSIGLAIYLARKNQPNLIISQEELTDSKAMNFFYELKSEPELARIPFVLLSSSKDSSLINESINNSTKIDMPAHISNEYNLPLVWQESMLSSAVDCKNKILALITKLPK